MQIVHIQVSMVLIINVNVLLLWKDYANIFNIIESTYVSTRFTNLNNIKQGQPY